MLRQPSIKQNNFAEFLTELKDASPNEKIHVLLDNCAVHRSRLGQKTADDLSIELIWNVPYSPSSVTCKHFKKCT